MRLDIGWELIKVNGLNIFEMFPDVQFYDYCKSPKRMLNFIDGKLPPNYHLTFSRSEKNWETCLIILACGGNVAAVFRDKLPKKYMGYRVIDADKNDLRFLDPKNVICGLVAKGKKGRKDKSGFVIG